jgi:2-polyprenyl-6-methoxyphenol hydroxylase-like FAD-dependent oxidoreductase
MRPPEESVKCRVTYSSQLLRMSPGAMREKVVLVGPVAGRSTGMALLRHENDTALFTAFGIAGVEPPGEFADMVEFVRGLAPDHIVDAIGAGEPLAEVAAFRYPETRWRRFDKLRRFPGGLLVLGDAMCSFNPAYGQGMTVAMLQAQALGDCLRQGPHNLARRYFRAAAKPIGVAWQFATGGDLDLPEVEGELGLAARLMNKYVKRLQAVAGYDTDVAERFLRVVGFLDPPATLMAPKMLMRVALHRGSATTSEAPMALARS